MIKPKAINRKKLVAFVLPIIRKEKLPMSEELEKSRHKQYVAERKLTAAKHKEKQLQYHIWKSASSSEARAALLLPELPTKPEKNCSPSTTRNPKTTEENSRKSFTRKSCSRQMPRRSTPTGQRSGMLSRKWKSNGTRSLPDDSFLPCREKS